MPPAPVGDLDVNRAETQGESDDGKEGVPGLRLRSLSDQFRMGC
jgi:hypothetical protein